MSETTKPTPAQELHGAAMQLKRQLDAERESKMDSAYSVGARPVATPIVREGIFQLAPDNGGTPPPQPPEK